MRTELQSKISPPEAFTPNMQNENEVGLVSGKPKVDFKKLLLLSNQEEMKKHTNGSPNLGASKNYEDFLEKLNSSARKDSAPKNTLGKDEFLKLFVAQLQNQDPLSPKDGSEMASQLAQFNGLEQMMNVNKTLERMEQASKGDKSVHFVNYLGKEIELNDGRVQLKSGKLGQSYMNITKPGEEIFLEIADASGKVVFKHSVVPTKDGDTPISWDAKDNNGQKVNDGVYKIKATTKDKDGIETPVEIVSTSTIESVDLKSDETEFRTPLGAVKFADIKKLHALKSPEAHIQNELIQKMPQDAAAMGPTPQEIVPTASVKNDQSHENPVYPQGEIAPNNFSPLVDGQ